MPSFDKIYFTMMFPSNYFRVVRIRFLIYFSVVVLTTVLTWAEVAADAGTYWPLILLLLMSMFAAILASSKFGLPSVLAPAVVIAAALITISPQLRRSIDVSSELDSQTLCPITRPIPGAVELIINTTDPLHGGDVAALRTDLAALVEDAPTGTRFTINLVTPVVDRPSISIFSRCKPPTADSGLTANPSFNVRRYRDLFHAPFEDAIKEAIANSQQSAVAPLIEAFKTVLGETSFREAPRQKVVILSDLMQSSPLANFYRYVPSYKDLARRYPDLFTLDLSHTEVLILRTRAIGMFPPAVLAQQQSKATQFWSEYFTAAHARELTFRTL
jgi:hypothetical protein